MNTIKSSIFSILMIAVAIALISCDSHTGKLSGEGKDYENEIKELRQQITQQVGSFKKLEQDFRNFRDEFESRLKESSYSTAKNQSMLSNITNLLAGVLEETTSAVATIQKLERNLAKKADQVNLENHLIDFEKIRQSVVNLYMQSQGGRMTTIYIDPSSKGFLRLDHDTGFFLISCKDAEPYIDGYKIIISVGNPFAGTYSNTKFKVKWGKKPTKKLENDDEYRNWRNTLFSKQIDVADDIRAGSWNNVELILTPAKPEDIGHIEITAESPIVSLTKPRQQ